MNGKLWICPSLPEPKTTKIPRGQSIAGLVFHSIFASIFIVILLRYVTVLGWYENDVLRFQLSSIKRLQINLFTSL